MLLAMLLAGADVESAFKRERVGVWLIAPDPHGCMADRVFADKSSVNIRYIAQIGKAFVGFSEPDLKFVHDGATYNLNIIFRHAEGTFTLSNNKWENERFVGATVGGMNAMVGVFTPTILNDFASSSGAVFMMGGSYVAGFQIADGAEMVTELKRCAAIRATEVTS